MEDPVEQETLTAPWREAVFLLRIAFSSAWQTYGYFVSRGSFFRDSFAQGSSLSGQPLGKPL